MATSNEFTALISDSQPSRYNATINNDQVTQTGESPAQTEHSNPEHDSIIYKTMGKFYIIF